MTKHVVRFRTASGGTHSLEWPNAAMAASSAKRLSECAGLYVEGLSVHEPVPRNKRAERGVTRMIVDVLANAVEPLTARQIEDRMADRGLVARHGTVPALLNSLRTKNRVTSDGSPLCWKLAEHQPNPEERHGR